MTNEWIGDALAAIGRRGIAGAGLAAFAVGAWFSFALPARDEAAALASRLERDAMRAARSSEMARPARRRGLYDRLPQAGSLVDQVARIRDIARDSNVALAQADAKRIRAGERLVRYELALPVRGDYASIRRFLAGVLNAMPFAALDSLAFGRSKIAEPVVEAQIRFVLFLDGAARTAPLGAQQPATR